MDKRYSYTAADENGRTVKGDISAASESEARQLLFERGLLATEVRPENSISLDKLLKSPVKDKEIILFCKQFRTLLGSGVPLTEILSILRDQAENKRLREALDDIARSVTEGKTLYDSFSRHGDIFPRLFLAMIRAGESSGALTEIFDRLSSMLSHEERVKKQIASALRYPKMVVASMLVAFVVLLNFVIPTFAQIFKTAKIELPLPTRIAIALNDLLSQWWYIAIPALAAVVYMIIVWSRTEGGKYAIDSLSLRLPIVGSVVQKSMLARFASIFSLLQKSGVSILDSLDILCDTLDNSAVSKHFVKVQEQLTAGQGLTGPISKVPSFTPLAVNMIRIGENSGNLDTMMQELAQHYDEEVEFAVGRLTEAIGPILLVLLGVVVLFFALAIFMPMWDMGKLAM